MDYRHLSLLHQQERRHQSESSENTPSDELAELIAEVVCGFVSSLAMGLLQFLLLCHPLPSSQVLLRWVERLCIRLSRWLSHLVDFYFSCLWSNPEGGLVKCIYGWWLWSIGFELKWVSSLFLLPRPLQRNKCFWCPSLPLILALQFGPILPKEEPFDLFFLTIEKWCRFFLFCSWLTWESMPMPSSKLGLLISTSLPSLESHLLHQLLILDSNFASSQFQSSFL